MTRKDISDFIMHCVAQCEAGGYEEVTFTEDVVAMMGPKVTRNAEGSMFVEVGSEVFELKISKKRNK